MYAQLYVNLLNKLSRADTLQSILVLLGEMLAGVLLNLLSALPVRSGLNSRFHSIPCRTDREDRIALFLNLSPYTPLLK